MCQVCGQIQRTTQRHTFTMTVGRREILFADPKETERLFGRILAGNEIITASFVFVLISKFVIQYDLKLLHYSKISKAILF